MPNKSKLLVVAFLLLQVEANASWPPPGYDPGLYVYFNHLIFEGKLISNVQYANADTVCANTVNASWYTPSFEACLLVTKVVHQRSGDRCAVGDTICFQYGKRLFYLNSTKPVLQSLDKRFSGPLGVPINGCGLFGLTVLKSGELRRGYQFALNDTLVGGVYDFLAKLEADSKSTTGELEKRFPGIVTKWRMTEK